MEEYKETKEELQALLKAWMEYFEMRLQKLRQMSQQARIENTIYRLGGEVRDQVLDTIVYELGEMPENLDELLKNFRWQMEGKYLAISGWIEFE